MTRRDELLFDALMRHVGHLNGADVVEQLWREGMIRIRAVERLVAIDEVSRLVARGQSKARACDEVSQLLGCSFEKVRNMLYERHNKQDEHKNQNNENENKD